MNHSEQLDVLTTIHLILYHLNAAAENHAELVQTAYVIYLAWLEPIRLFYPQKWLYPAAARHFFVTVSEITHSIAAVMYSIYRRNPSFSECFAELSYAQFIKLILYQMPDPPAA